MNLEELRQRQAPIKDRYRTEPNSALVTLKCSGTVDVGNQHCSLDSFAGEVRAGLHPAAGGSSADACSAEMLLESLVACAGVTLAAVATNMGIVVDQCTISAEGDMDFRGTLGVDRTAPVGLTAIRLRFQIESAAEATLIEKLIQLTERYCVIYQTLSRGVPAISTEVVGSGQH
jgi:uncharacterized OsmC-like protein